MLKSEWRARDAQKGTMTMGAAAPWHWHWTTWALLLLVFFGAFWIGLAGRAYDVVAVPGTSASYQFGAQMGGLVNVLIVGTVWAILVGGVLRVRYRHNRPAVRRCPSCDALVSARLPVCPHCRRRLG
jgi:hypothetical protein